MKEIPVEVYCPLDLKTRTVYCFKITEDMIVSNGCEFLHQCNECDECCKRSVPLAKSKLSKTFTDFSFQKSE